jgi:oxygen-independent coproporphyrinogen-3 oxidase
MDRMMELARPLPRYTSYPTAPNFRALTEEEKLACLHECPEPLSLYVHIPFCRKICLYCGCSSLMSRSVEKDEIYVAALIREIEQARRITGRKKVCEIHFGGGTPTKLSNMSLERIYRALEDHFEFVPGVASAIEIDPRTVDRARLQFLRSLGFNRVSFGVQDFDPAVQEAIGRRQTATEVEENYFSAREVGFGSIHFDLIYGLPGQSVKSFDATQKKVIELSPDRISLFSFAYLPHLKLNQRAIPLELLPKAEEKFAILEAARRAFCDAGYIAIGMDHFARPGDALARSYQDGTLFRSFQGYTSFHAQSLLGFGMTAIGQTEKSYFQNWKSLEHYYEAINRGVLPLERGLFLNSDDLRRRYVIEEIMCRFRVSKSEFRTKFEEEFDRYFEKEKEALNALSDLIEDSSDSLRVSREGELFLRNIASCFDAYLENNQTNHTFSHSI